MWHHICVTWRSTNGAWQFYLDGQLQSNGTGLKENHQIPAGGTVVIGQDQDTVGGASKPLIVLDQVRLQKLIFGAESYQRVILQHSMQTVT